ncbi:DUF3817 domain-containing protein [Pengzhenrongella sp.]|jgi:integral membrane protein|uniref:DUF3817 domain-containing protein n=1 Tax=Pengzhenrongella sp. TaxID=2888820 RepID=UPI002F94B77A
MTPPLPRTGRTFAVLATIEAITWAGLLVGMFLKYVTETTEAGVWLFGRLHGAAFVAYLIVTLVAARRLRWSSRVTLLALVASIPPLATLAFERWARRRGMLHAPSATVAADRADSPDSAETLVSSAPTQ